MEKVIHSLIKEDQTGFIKGRNASDNMRRLLHILDFADSHPTPCAVFSLDAEKAFDRLEWNYMWAVLQCFGEHFISMIKTLYHSPAASVITGNIISPSFPLQRGRSSLLNHWVIQTILSKRLNPSEANQMTVFMNGLVNQWFAQDNEDLDSNTETKQKQHSCSCHIAELSGAFFARIS